MVRLDKGIGNEEPAHLRIIHPPVLAGPEPAAGIAPVHITVLVFTVIMALAPVAVGGTGWFSPAVGGGKAGPGVDRHLQVIVLPVELVRQPVPGDIDPLTEGITIMTPRGQLGPGRMPGMLGAG